MISKEQLDNITSWLKWNIFRNGDVMWSQDCETEQGARFYDLIDMVASLHNLLYEAITGDRYDYWFHWCNKIGSDCNENFFDEIMNEKEG